MVCAGSKAAGRQGDCSFWQVGREEELSLVVIRRDSGFRKLWHPVEGRMQGTGTGLGFCNLSLSQSVLQAWLGVTGGTVPCFIGP